jgi:sulfotransferase
MKNGDDKKITAHTQEVVGKGGKGGEEAKRKFYFIAGLPRSGSTLLANILAQNPRFHATSTSGIMDVMFGVRNTWDKLIEFQAHPDEDGKLRVLRGILNNFYEDVEKPVVFDKCRGWLSLIEMGEKVLGERMKILVPVRDMRDVLSSFEKLWRETSKTSQVPQESQNYFQFQTVEGRCNVWLSADQPVGLAYNRVRDAVARGYRDRMHFIDFDRLTTDPERELAAVYNFLDEKPFEHNFNHVEQVTWEDDSVHGFKSLHAIRNKVTPMEPQWPYVLGKFADNFASLNFWRN